MPDRSRMSAFSVAIGGLADVAEKWKNDVSDRCCRKRLENVAEQ